MKLLSDPLSDRVMKEICPPPHHFLSEKLLFQSKKPSLKINSFLCNNSKN